ncbi:hypothetical protein M5K25_004663 [Dendrobium thyrsiflorum]|uniref:Uncharacterized protein n=1 Tax=Dendrobium thyrsiflorum TaxID=117978 RepID=A0ABD0VMT9_DENTH
MFFIFNLLSLKGKEGNSFNFGQSFSASSIKPGTNIHLQQLLLPQTNPLMLLNYQHVAPLAMERHAWNICAFNSPDKVICCKNLVSNASLDMLCILENIIHTSTLSDPWFRMTHSIFENEDSFNNFELLDLGRTWIKCNKARINFDPILVYDQMLCGTSFLLSVIYATNSQYQHVKSAEIILWDFFSASLSWVLGNFNCCIYSTEKVGGNEIHNSRLWDFNSLFFYTGLEELAYVGSFYTCFNQRVENPIHIKLKES